LEAFDIIVRRVDMTRPPNGNSAVWLGRCRNASSQGLAYAVMRVAADLMGTDPLKKRMDLKKGLFGKNPVIPRSARRRREQ